MHSSGTTGLPKPVIHTHRTILEGPKFRAVDYKEEPGALIAALPQSHQGTISFTSYAPCSPVSRCWHGAMSPARNWRQPFRSTGRPW